MPVGLNENPVGFVDPAMPLDWSHPLNRGLVSRWKVIPNSGWRGGLTFRDLVRGGKKPNDGTLTNGPTWVGGGRRGGYGALSFDGTDDYGAAPANITGFDLYESVSCWVRLDNAGTFPVMVGGTSNWGGNEFRFAWSSRQPEFFAGGNANSAVAATALTLGQWYHVCGTADQSTVNVTAKIYVNGVLDGTDSRTIGVAVANASWRYFGSRSGSNLFLQGALDDVCLWNRELSAREVSQLYQEQLRGSPETLKWVGARTYGFSEQAAATGGTPIFSSGILSSRIIGGGGIAA